jgi:GT2 family glycosyltransferase
VKVFEYLSAGKPVVATSLPELLPLHKVVSLYSTPFEFIDALEKALQNDSADLHKKRIAVAKKNTWSDRYRLLTARMTELFGKVSIIIITWNNLEHTRKCVQSVLMDQTWPNFELIIVDNASTDGTQEYLKELESQYENVCVILNSSNIGFAAGNNIGLRHTQDAEYIILLNNDTVVPIGWMARLIKHLRNTEIGMVGPVTNSIGNEARIDVPYQNMDDMKIFAQWHMIAHDGETFEIGVLAMYCVAIRKDVMDEIGPLDESFGIGMFEDDDYARRVRLKGYRIVCAEDVFVHHSGKASFSKMDSGKYKELFEKNRGLFEKKWDTVWMPHKRSNSGEKLL